jgi:hypothetical protein
VVGLLLVLCAAAQAQDVNIALPVPELEQMLTNDPFTIVSAEISRPKAKGDITLKAEASFAGRDPIRVKLRKAEPGADGFNNVPRYDLAAYELQKLLMDAPEYVVPPTALRFVPLADFKKYTNDVSPTFKGSDEVLAVLQYWINEVKVIADVFNEQRFESDPQYARYIGQLNVFTYLIEHSDSNAGNFLISRAEKGPRVFSIDNGVAFASPESDRGKLWKKMRVERIPADTATRLKNLTREQLEAKLGVVAQWELKDGRWTAVPLGANLSANRGVRKEEGLVQMGLTSGEIAAIWRQVQDLVKDLDKGKLQTF